MRAPGVRRLFEPSPGRGDDPPASERKHGSSRKEGGPHRSLHSLIKGTRSGARQVGWFQRRGEVGNRLAGLPALNEAHEEAAKGFAVVGSPPEATVAAPRRISFEVEGRPRQQGSMRSPRAGVVLHDSTHLKGWREAVGVRCREVYKGLPHRGPVQLSLFFTFKTPREHRGQTQKTTKPDLDKLIRAVCDGLTGVLYADDEQVFHIEAEKAWSAEVPEGVGIEAWLQPMEARA